MKHTKSIMEVKIRLDPVLGWGHEPKDHVEWLQKLLDQTVPHYHPTVQLTGTEVEKE